MEKGDVSALLYFMIVAFCKELLSVLTNGFQVGIKVHLPFSLTLIIKRVL